jgi:hypothetical protein
MTLNHGREVNFVFQDDDVRISTALPELGAQTNLCSRCWQDFKEDDPSHL